MAIARFVIAALALVSVSGSFAAEDTAWTSTLDRISSGVVSIRVDSTRAFDTEWNSSSQATGFVVDGLPSISVRAAAIITWLAIVNTALAFTLWNLSLQRLTAVESAGINSTMLIQIAVLAWIFLGEAPGMLGLIGIVTVSAGVFLRQTASANTITPRRRRASDQPTR